MTRRRYVYDKDLKEMVEVGAPEQKERSHMLQMDITPFVSTVDGTHIGSRSDLRRHMKRHDLVHTDDYKETWTKQAKERELRERGVHPDQKRARERTLSEAYEHARNKSRYFR